MQMSARDSPVHPRARPLKATDSATGDGAWTIRRKFPWRWVGIAVSLAIVGYAFVTLFHLLRDIELAKVMAALQATSPQTIVLAALAVAAGYVTLTFYDFFALRTIGRNEVPYRMAAFTGFTAYTIGHTLGATVFTGGVVRYRIYSAWGLSLIEVAKIAFITGLTFWLGNAFLLGMGVAYAPEAATLVNQLPPWINRALALTEPCRHRRIPDLAAAAAARGRAQQLAGHACPTPSSRSSRSGSASSISGSARSRCTRCCRRTRRSTSSA